MDRTSHPWRLALSLSLTLATFACANASTQELNSVSKDFFKSRHQLNPSQERALEQGKVLAMATVKSNQEGDQKKQALNFENLALHSQSCSLALKKLALYEKYSEWIGFITSSHYDEEKKLLSLRIDHTLLPYPMLVEISVTRVNSPGEYSFSLPSGIFKGLAGKARISPYRNRCLFLAYGNWEGPDTGLPDLAVEVFTQALTKMGAGLLLRKTRF